MELLSLEQRTFYSKYFLYSILSGVIVFLLMKFVFDTPDSYFVEIYPDLKALVCVNIFIGLFLSERKAKLLVYISRIYVLANFSLFGFFTGCVVLYLSVMNK
ncbi:hypothetical protein C4K38_4283 [Pseudomonas chlororaphis subsp. piscium]|nr:hypothetical protein C4K38_4283 [Pseudomonas chlororaphis subsp. piscium]AZC83243.1 hypothetical protein C4K30_4137 [Pseudomonas chlororaphis subsp. piscium]AZC90581.1 hypothetical protein C4K29_4288 [Pseudomonas chlororaphis subsp. piscium]SDS70161.1 hypothetical protein SAMN05216585_3110 [Pseudomonas chlororaphis]